MQEIEKISKIIGWVASGSFLVSSFLARPLSTCEHIITHVIQHILFNTSYSTHIIQHILFNISLKFCVTLHIKAHSGQGYAQNWFDINIDINIDIAT